MCKPLRYSMLVLILGFVLTNAASAADPSLVAHFKFDDGSGTTAIDSSGNGNDGVLNDDPQWVEGKLGGALEFDGTGDYVEIQRPIGDDFTMSAWINTATEGAGGTQAYQGTGLLWSDVGGAANDFVVAVLGTKLSFFCGNPDLSVNSNGDIVTGDWVHIAVVRDTGSQTISVYIDGILDNSISHSNTNTLDAQPVLAIGANVLDNRYYTGLIDEVQIYNRALAEDEIPSTMGSRPGVALNPSPVHEADDIIRDTVLSWLPGEYAGKHHVYFGESFEDVNAATTPTAASLDVNSFDPGRFEFDKLYFWRVDEVNATPDKTVYRGDVWSFTSEPYSIQIPYASMVVTASSVSNEFSPPTRTIDGSGLGADNTHAVSSETMWFTAAVDLDPWIQYEFDDVYKLDLMKVWNSNSAAEAAIGWGVRDLQIETSVDGESWDVLEPVTQFNRAPGLPTYNQFDTVAFNGVAARYVRLDIQNNWGGILMSYGLSEVQFERIPTQPRTPVPAVDSVNILPGAVLSWRAGREADQHTLYMNTDANAVADGSAPSVSLSTNSAALSTLDAQLGETYYWRVDEVNHAEAVSVWAGPVWTFSTADRVAVDDFEGYGNASPDRPFQTWLDGIGYSSDEYYPVAYPGNGSGAAVGHDIWSLSSPHYQGDIMEQILTAEASGQSMPVYYSGNSHTDRIFETAQDWSAAGIKTLVMYFNGDRGNAAGTLYVTLNNTRVDYPNASALSSGVWTQWNIDLASLGIALDSITKMSIGIDSTGSGLLLVDQISLFRDAPEAPTSSDPGTANLAALYSFENDYTDGSGHGLTGVPMGLPTFVDGLSGLGSAISLNGADDYIELPIGSLMSTLTDATFSIWANFSGEGDNWQRLIDFGSGTTQYFLITPSSGSGVLLMEMNGPDAGTSQVAAPMRLPTGWHHVAGVIDSTAMEMTLYLDGVAVAQGPTASLPADAGVTTQNWLGRSQYPDPYYDGALDELHIYNRALSEGEIRYLAGDR